MSGSSLSAKATVVGGAAMYPKHLSTEKGSRSGEWARPPEKRATRRAQSRTTGCGDAGKKTYVVNSLIIHVEVEPDVSTGYTSFPSRKTEFCLDEA